MRHTSYSGKVAILTTKHNKLRLIARPMACALKLEVRATAGVDTDVLGTFSGEIARPGTPREVVVRKARLGMKAECLSLGFASEGSFGAHPLVPFAAAGEEHVAFVDDEIGIVVVESLVTAKTNFGHVRVRRPGELDSFLLRAGFPSHALIARPNAGTRSLLFKGLTDPLLLASAVEECVAASNDGLALVETDMRAHLNPTRRVAIRRVAFRLARRLATACPECRTPGYGLVGVERGLPCEGCLTPTEMVRAEVLGCPKCAHREKRRRRDGRMVADAAQCPLCNP